MVVQEAKRCLASKTALQYCRKMLAATSKVQHPKWQPHGYDLSQSSKMADSASNISPEREPTVAIFPFEYPAHFWHCPPEDRRLTFKRLLKTAPRQPLSVIIGRLISHPPPLTCTWRCSCKRSRHPSFGGAPPSGSELLRSNTPSRSQFAAGPASVSGGASYRG
jgi:hypothetical protein